VISRESSLRIARLASEVLKAAAVEKRSQDGYTRVDPVAIAETQGISVMLQPMDRLLGAFLAEDDVGILLNSQRPSGMVHMTCAHELGHYFLEHGTTLDDQLDYDTGAGDKELEADQFAYSLMVPQWLFTTVMKGQGWGLPSLQDAGIVYQLSLRMGVSYAAMVWSLARMKRIPHAQASMLAKMQLAQIKQSLSPPGTKLSRFQDVWLLRPRDKDFILEPRTHDLLMIDLPAHTGSGYLWSFSEAQGEGYALRPVLEDERGSRPGSRDDVWVGTPPSLRYSLDVPPTTEESFERRLDTLHLREVQPWRGAKSSRDSLNLVSKAEMIQDGLTNESRLQWIGAQPAQGGQ